MSAAAKVAFPAPPIRFADIAARLAKRCMYDGATQSFYSEAQHAVILASEAVRIGGPLAGLYGLLRMAHRAMPMISPEFANGFIHAAIDLDWPAPLDTTRLLDAITARLELAELQQMVPGADAEIARRMAAGTTPLRRLLKPLSWDRAQDQFSGQLRALAVQALLPATPAMAGIL
jgi:hypothetical protein